MLDDQFGVTFDVDPCLSTSFYNANTKEHNLVLCTNNIFVPSLSSCHEKATVALYFGRIRTRFGVVHFRVFQLFLWLLTTEFASWSKPPSRDNHRKAPYPMRVRAEPGSRDRDHTIAIKMAL